MLNRIWLAFLVGAINISTFVVFFLQGRLGLVREKAAAPAANLLLIVGIMILVTALLSGWLADRFGHKRMVAYAGLLAALGTLIALGSSVSHGVVLRGKSGGLFVSVARSCLRASVRYPCRNSVSSQRASVAHTDARWSLAFVAGGATRRRRDRTRLPSAGIQACPTEGYAALKVPHRCRLTGKTMPRCPGRLRPDCKNRTEPVAFSPFQIRSLARNDEIWPPPP